MKKILKIIIIAFCLNLNYSIANAQQTVTEIYKEGISFMDAKDYVEAIKSFKKVLKLDALHKKSLYKLGWCYNEEEQHNQAIYFLLKVPNKEEDEKVNFELGYAHFKLENLKDAEVYFKKSINIKPSQSDAHKYLGDIYSLQKLSSAAINSYFQAIKIDSANTTAMYELGYLYNQEKSYNLAVEVLNKMVSIKPTYKTYNELGFAYYKLKQNEKAIEAYNNGFITEPNQGTSYKGIADVYRMNFVPAKIDDAIKYYKLAALKYTNTSASCQYGLGWCYNSKSMYSEAFIELEKAIKADTDFEIGYTEIGYTCYRLLKYTDALAYLAKGTQINPKSAINKYYTGLVYIAQKDRANATRIAEELKSLNADYSSRILKGINW